MADGFDYYIFQTTMVRKKIEEEIDFYEKSEFKNEILVSDIIKYLKTRLGVNIPEQKTVASYDKFGNRREIKKMNLEDYGKDMNIMMFKLPWEKLKEINKIIKIEEYINNLKYSNKVSEKKISENRSYVRNEIINNIKEKKFAKNKNVVEYDEENMVITSINCIKKANRLYDVDWNF